MKESLNANSELHEAGLPLRLSEYDPRAPMKTASVPTSIPRYSVLISMLALCATFLQREWACAAPAVVGLWRFNEGSGTNVLDSSGSGNNGTLAGENGNVPAWVAGQPGFGNALQFTNNGTDHSYVNIPAANSLKIGQTSTNPWTITAWAYEISNGAGDFAATYGRILVLDDGVAFQFESGASGDAQIYTWSELNVPWQLNWGVGSAVAPLLDQWVHWAVVYDNTNLTLYRNANQGAQGGVASMPVTAALAIPGYLGAIIIGSQLDQSGNRTWNGMLDDVAVFAGALTEGQVATVMAGDFSAFISAAPGITSQPESLTVPQGSTATFSVGAAGQQPLSYQWYFNDTNRLSALTNPTATSASLELTNLQLNQSGIYSVVVTNAFGSVTSQPALLTVFNRTLVGLWRFNEGSGTNALDSSGLENHGILLGQNGNAPSWVGSQPGFGTALRFTNDAVNHSAVTVPASGSLLIGQTATNPWTIAAWAYEISNGAGDFVANYGRILVIDDGTAFQLESGASGDAELYTWARADTAWQINWGVGSAVAPLLDQWEHWAVAYDGTNLTVYRNGNSGTNGGVASQAVTAAIGGYIGFQDALEIGSELGQPADRTWNGMLDDVAVFNIALSQDQVQAVMSGNFTAFIPPPRLFASRSAGNIVMSWSATLPTFRLQSNTNLASAAWSNVSTTPVQNGNVLTVTLPMTPGPGFFRLVGP